MIEFTINFETGITVPDAKVMSFIDALIDKDAANRKEIHPDYIMEVSLGNMILVDALRLAVLRGKLDDVEASIGIPGGPRKVLTQRLASRISEGEFKCDDIHLYIVEEILDFQIQQHRARKPK